MDYDMDEPEQERSIWNRGLYMLVFAFCLWVAKFVAWVVVVFQFLAAVFTGAPNLKLLSFGRSLSIYHYQLLMFLTFNSEEHPYPLGDWPEADSRLPEGD